MHRHERILEHGALENCNHFAHLEKGLGVVLKGEWVLHLDL